MKTISTLRLAIATVLAFGVASVQAAGSANTSMNLTVDVPSNCLISTADIDFGTYDPIFANASTDAAGSAVVTTTCTLGSVPRLSLNNGTNNLLSQRRLYNNNGVTTDPTDFLNYAFYSDAGSTVWLNNALATAGSGFAETDTIYAKIPAGQNVTVGTYTDDVQVTVNF